MYILSRTATDLRHKQQFPLWQLNKHNFSFDILHTTSMALNEDEETVLRDLVQENYVYLVRRIQVRDFVPHLISASALTIDDKEVIESKVTQVDRAGACVSFLNFISVFMGFITL